MSHDMTEAEIKPLIKRLRRHKSEFRGVSWPSGIAEEAARALEALQARLDSHTPTQWAYDKACEVLHKWESRAKAAEAQVAALREALDNVLPALDRAQDYIVGDLEHDISLAAALELALRQARALAPAPQGKEG